MTALELRYSRERAIKPKAHLLPAGSYGPALCGFYTRYWNWHDSPMSAEYAAELPLCKSCSKKGQPS